MVGCTLERMPEFHMLNTLQRLKLFLLAQRMDQAEGSCTKLS